jgi:hypothetical protein
MKYAVKMDSDVVTYIPCFIKMGSGIRNLMGGIHRHADTHKTTRKSHKPQSLSLTHSWG